MKKAGLLFLGLLFLMVSFASEVLADYSRGDRGGARRRAEQEYRHHRSHDHHHRDWRRNRHRDRGHRRHHRHDWHHHRYYYDEPYYHGGYYYPGTVVHFDPFGWLFQPPPVVVEKPTPATYEDDDDSDVTSPSELEKRLEKLRTRAIRDFSRGTPMPRDVFDGMSSLERRAYGKVFDDINLASGGKYPYFKKEWR